MLLVIQLTEQHATACVAGGRGGDFIALRKTGGTVRAAGISGQPSSGKFLKKPSQGRVGHNAMDGRAALACIAHSHGLCTGIAGSVPAGVERHGAVFTIHGVLLIAVVALHILYK
jgi:hypothetical protein